MKALGSLAANTRTKLKQLLLHYQVTYKQQSYFHLLTQITIVVQYSFGKLLPTPHPPIIDPLWF